MLNATAILCKHCITTAFAQEWRGGTGAAGSTKSTVRRQNKKTTTTTAAAVDAAAAELGMHL
jgi:hypothetical protein